MESTEQTLILKTGRVKENDLWLKLFSPHRGVFTAFAFGGLRSRRRFCGCLDVFNHVLFTIRSPGNGKYLQLLEGSLINGYPNLRRDPSKLGAAVNCLQFFDAVHIGPEGAQTAFELMTNTLDAINGENQTPAMLPVFFRLKVLLQQGVFPQTTFCCRCNRPHDPAVQGVVQVHTGEGSIVCSDCANDGEKDVINLDPWTLDIIAAVAMSDPPAWSGLIVTEESARELDIIIDRFVGRHLGLNWKDGRFIAS
ncbi:DNA repair protein RecO [Desulfovibrio inopinatus]|uniref:DNA repair protein RecO n=1 Tax=Desulfovibrio inopinatus TaxID=102109 RepID=UPI00040FBBD2|nr:DNA repair protein RecO [Desulfovibrio inopinatus]